MLKFLTSIRKRRRKWMQKVNGGNILTLLKDNWTSKIIFCVAFSTTLNIQTFSYVIMLH